MIRTKYPVLMMMVVLMCMAGCSASRNSPAHKPELTRKPELTSLLGRPLYPLEDPEQVADLEAKLAAARRDQAEHPDDPAKIVWVGRRLGYLWRMNEAIAVLSEGIERFPDYAPLYRHRGHRYISLRRFDDAINDLEMAAQLIANRPDEIEEDGMPNEQNIPLTTTGFNVWYHLALARYLSGDFEGAEADYIEALKYCGNYEDNLVAVVDWLYMTYRRSRHDQRAAGLLMVVRPEMKIIENHAYHRRLLMYKGELSPDDLLDPDNTTELDLATQGYGVGNWYLYNGDNDAATTVFERVVSGNYWPAFGFIASEVELARQRQAGSAP